MTTDPAAAGGPLHVLIAARGYPAADNPVRGIFVADQAAALRSAGADVAVASWESAVRLRSDHDDAGPGSTPRAWLEVAANRTELARPRSWGAPGVPVARLPTVVELDEHGAADPVTSAERQSETLVAFGHRLADRWPIHVVHAHTGLPDGVAAARLAHRLAVPLVVTEHDSTLAKRLSTERGRTAYRALIGPGRRLVAVSATMRVRMAALLHVPAAIIEVIPNPIDLTAFHVVGPAERDPDELLWVGSRQAAKGTDRLLGAFALLRAERPSLRLRLVGWAPTAAEETRLRSLAGALGVETAVRFEPRADRAGVAEAMARAAVFVHPSPAETFGMVAAEALACGLPVAATPSGGVDEIVGDDGTRGSIAATVEPAALATAIGSVLDRRASFDPGQLRRHVEDRYAPPAVANRLLALYAELGARPTADERRPSAPGAIRTARATAGDDVAPAAGPVQARSRDVARPLVVGMRRGPTISRIGHLPPELAESLVVVTSTGPADGASPSDGPTWLEVDADWGLRDARRRLGGPPASGPALSRLVRAARHPIRTIRLRRLAGRRGELALEAQRAAIRDALRGIPRDADGSVEILPLDVHDLFLVGPLLGPAVGLFPTTLRGLADRWDAAGRPPVVVRPPEGATNESAEPVPDPAAVRA